jgi:hypothetical protein
MGDGTDQREPHRSQIVEYEAWLETLYTLHVPFEEQEDPTPSRKLHVIAEGWFLDNVFRSNDLRTTALYTMDDDRASELIGDCYFSIMDMSISKRCKIQVKPIPEGKGDPRFTRKQFGVLGWVPDEDGDYDYLIIDRIGVEELVADDPEALKRNVYARLLSGFNIQVVD